MISPFDFVVNVYPFIQSLGLYIANNQEYISQAYDKVAIVIALLLLAIAQTKTSLVTAAEFLLYNIYSFFIIYFSVTTPFLWLGYAFICWGACKFHKKFRSHLAIVTAFALAMLYNLCMFHEWASSAYVSNGNYEFFSSIHAYVMWFIIACQLLATSIYGGLGDGLARWRRNLANRNLPYLRSVEDWEPAR